MKGRKSTDHENVVDLFSGKPFSSLQKKRIVRITPEIDGLCMLYGNNRRSEKLYPIPVFAWGVRENGEIVGLTSWLNSVFACTELADPFDGHWEGYFDPSTETIFQEPPLHKKVELETACKLLSCQERSINQSVVLQEIPDTVGTHALLKDGENQDDLHLKEVFSWQLLGDGSIVAMIAEPTRIRRTPILPGNEALYPVNRDGRFRYFFQFDIANQIKSLDPDALSMISALVDFNHI